MDLFRKYKQEDTIVTFKDDEYALFYALKDGIEIIAAIEVVVKVNGKKIATYHKEFEDSFNNRHYSEFIKKFLEVPDYRDRFSTDGSWNGTIAFSNDTGVNKECEKQINRLNRNGNPKFKDYSALKTHGLDKFSRMKVSVLVERIGKERIKIIQEELEDEKERLSAMRWIGRGLRMDHAIRKIKTDRQIRQNKK